MGTIEVNGITISNIDKTCNGTEYAYEREGKFDTEYIANCIEYGEEFYSNFYAPSTYTKEQIKDVGMDMALAWGGECISVDKVIRHNTDGSVMCVKVC